MAQVLDLEGLPDPVAKAIVETVLNLKNRYRGDSPVPAVPERAAKPLKDLPSRPGTAIGNISRVEISDER